jgi:hypothetical protein
MHSSWPRRLTLLRNARANKGQNRPRPVLAWGEHIGVRSEVLERRHTHGKIVLVPNGSQ